MIDGDPGPEDAGLLPNCDISISTVQRGKFSFDDDDVCHRRWNGCSMSDGDGSGRRAAESSDDGTRLASISVNNLLFSDHDGRATLNLDPKPLLSASWSFRTPSTVRKPIRQRHEAQHR